MALTEEAVIDQITVDQDGNISVRTLFRILRDGVLIATVPHRHALPRGTDTTREDARVKDIATAMWDDEKYPPSDTADAAEVALSG